jgi:hypothetical protein
MNRQRCASYVLLAGLTLVVWTTRDTLAQKSDDKKASLSLKASPPVGFSPLKVRLTADVKGGPDDNVDFYCPSIAWEWGDDLTSESSEDCPPFEAGKSTIRRQYTTEHTYRGEGMYTARLKIKQGKRVVASTTVNVQVRGGARDDIDNP